MLKKIFLFSVILCLGFSSCKKTVDKNTTTEIREGAAKPAAKTDCCGCNPIPGSTFFDPTCLISASQKGKLDTIERGYGFTEGPAVDKWGNVFFTDQPNDKIYKWDATSKRVSLFLTGTGRSNGMAFDKYGNIIACADMHGELWKIRPNGTHEVLVNNYRGKLLNGPNDVWINPANGGIYITDPIFPRDYWDANDPRKQPWEPTHSEQAEKGKGGHVYYLAPGSHTLVRVTTMGGWNSDVWPNGITGTSDGKKLFVNNWTYDGTGKIRSFKINSNGRLSEMKTLVDNLNFCDGMSMDDNDNIYVSGGVGVNAYDSHGKKVMTISPGGGTNNVFAGKDNKLLFMTGPVDRVTSVQMNVKGVEKFGAH